MNQVGCLNCLVGEFFLAIFGVHVHDEGCSFIFVTIVCSRRRHVLVRKKGQTNRVGMVDCFMKNFCSF